MFLVFLLALLALLWQKNRITMICFWSMTNFVLYQSGLKLLLTIKGASLGPWQISQRVPFWENSQQLKTLFSKRNAPPQRFDRVLNIFWTAGIEGIPTHAIRCAPWHCKPGLWMKVDPLKRNVIIWDIIKQGGWPNFSPPKMKITSSVNVWFKTSILNKRIISVSYLYRKTQQFYYSDCLYFEIPGKKCRIFRCRTIHKTLSNRTPICICVSLTILSCATSPNGVQRRRTNFQR